MTRTYTSNAIAQLIADDLKRQGVKATRIFGKADFDVQQSAASQRFTELLGASKHMAELGGEEQPDPKATMAPTVKTKSITFYAEVQE